MTPLSAFLILVLPACIVAIGLSLAAVPGNRRAAEEPRPAPRLLARLVPPILLLLAFWSADIGQNQWHDFWPKNGTQRYLALAAAAALLGAIHAGLQRPAVTAGLRAALGALVVLALLSPIPEQYVPRWVLAVLCLACAVWLPLAGIALDAAPARLPRPAAPGVMLLCAALAAPGLYLSTYAEGALLMGSLAAIAGGMLASGAFLKGASALLPGGHTVWLALMAALLVVTYGYQDVPAWWALALMPLGPFGALAGLHAKRPLARVAAAWITAAAITGGATLAIVVSAPNDDPDSSYGS